MPWLYKQAGSDNWWVGYRVNGVQKRHTTGTANRKDADAELDRIKSLLAAKKAETLTAEVIAAITGRQPPKITLKQEVAAWLTQAEHATEEKTFARYTGIMETFAAHFKANDTGPMLGDVTTEQLREYFTARLRDVSPSTANLERKLLRMFFKQARDAEAIKSNPVLPIKHFKGKGVVKRLPFTIKQLKDIYASAEHAWQYMVLGGFYTGFRMGDLATMQWEKIDWAGRVFNTRDDKTDKSLHIPIAAPLFDWLHKEWFQQMQPESGFIVPELADLYNTSGSGALSNAFYKLMKAAGIKLPDRAKKHRKEKEGRSARRQTNALSFHSLRHSFITFLKSTGASQAVAKELAGHSSDALSDHYTHMPPAALADAVSKLPEFAG
jgi:integrase